MSVRNIVIKNKGGEDVGLVRVSKNVALDKNHKSLYTLEVFKTLVGGDDEEKLVATVDIHEKKSAENERPFAIADYWVTGHEPENKSMFISPDLDIARINDRLIDEVAEKLGVNILEKARTIEILHKNKIRQNSYDAGKPILDIFCASASISREGASPDGELHFSMVNPSTKKDEHFLIKIHEDADNSKHNVNKSKRKPFRGTLSLYQKDDKGNVQPSTIATVTFTDDSLTVNNNLLHELKITKPARLELFKGGHQETFGAGAIGIMRELLRTLDKIDLPKREAFTKYLLDPDNSRKSFTLTEIAKASNEGHSR